MSTNIRLQILPVEWVAGRIEERCRTTIEAAWFLDFSWWGNESLSLGTI